MAFRIRGLSEFRYQSPDLEHLRDTRYGELHSQRELENKIAP